MITPFAAKRAAEICATLRTCPQGYREGSVASRVVWSVAEAIQRTTADASLFDSQTGYVVALVMAPKERGTVFLVGSNRLFVAMRRMDSGERAAPAGSRVSVRVVPQPTPLDQVPVDALGWLAPDGRFFACAFTMHDDLARLLTGAEYGDARDGTQVLERHGWLRVVYGGYVGRASGALRCTQAQLDTLFELSQSARMTDLYRTNVWHMVQLYEVM